jgi:hypothetical protein
MQLPDCTGHARHGSDLPEIIMRLLTITLLCLAAPAAMAQGYLPFHAPSGNIHCAIFTGDFSGARCDIFEVTVMSFPNPPPDCDLDWGHAFEVGPIGSGGPVCAGDTVADPGGFELGYGKSVSLGAYTCQSETTGMTCTNGQGHGFSIRKAGQKVF